MPKRGPDTPARLADRAQKAAVWRGNRLLVHIARVELALGDLAEIDRLLVLNTRRKRAGGQRAARRGRRHDGGSKRCLNRCRAWTFWNSASPSRLRRGRSPKAMRAFEQHAKRSKEKSAAQARLTANTHPTATMRTARR